MVAGSIGDTPIPCTSVAGAGSAICSHALAVSARGTPPLTVAPGDSGDEDGAEAVPHAAQTSPTTTTKTPCRNQRDENVGSQEEPLARSVRMEYPFLPKNDSKTLQ